MILRGHVKEGGVPVDGEVIVIHKSIVHLYMAFDNPFNTSFLHLHNECTFYCVIVMYNVCSECQRTEDIYC